MMPSATPQCFHQTTTPWCLHQTTTPPSCCHSHLTSTSHPLTVIASLLCCLPSSKSPISTSMLHIQIPFANSACQINCSHCFTPLLSAFLQITRQQNHAAHPNLLCQQCLPKHQVIFHFTLSTHHFKHSSSTIHTHTHPQQLISQQPKHHDSTFQHSNPTHNTSIMRGNLVVWRPFFNLNNYWTVSSTNGTATKMIKQIKDSM